MAEIIDTEASMRRRRRVALIIAAGAALATIVAVALLMNIFERKQEARNPFYRVVELTDDTEDPALDSDRLASRSGGESSELLGGLTINIEKDLAQAHVEGQFGAALRE